MSQVMRHLPNLLQLFPVGNLHLMTLIPDFLVIQPIKVKMSCLIESWNEMLNYNNTPKSAFVSLLTFPYVHFNFPH